MNPERPARKERIQARRIPKPETYHPNHKVRNLMMGGSLSLVLLAIICLGVYAQGQKSELNSVNNPANILIEAPEAYYKFGVFPSEIATLQAQSPLDKEYLQHLFDNLHIEQGGNKEDRVKAVVDHFTHIGTSAGGSGSALQIDESGIYLTAAHLFTNNAGNVKPEKFYAHTPKGDDRMLQAESAIFTDWETDLAIVYVPTGKLRKAVKDIVLKDQPVQGEKAWLLGTSAVQRDYTYLGILKGVVDYNDPYVKPGKNLLSVVDMIPFGGSSGGPVIDSEGRVIGVESGKLLATGNPNDPNAPRDQYVGAAIAPVSFLKEFPTKPVIKLRGLK